MDEGETLPKYQLLPARIASGTHPRFGACMHTGPGDHVRRLDDLRSGCIALQASVRVCFSSIRSSIQESMCPIAPEMSSSRC
jgi:hypothetical protein